MTRRASRSEEEMAAAIAAMPEPAAIDDNVVLTSHYDDAISRDGRMLVLADNTVLMLSEVGSAALRHAESGISVRELGELLLEEFGAPPGERDVPRATRQVISALEWRGLLRRADEPGNDAVAGPVE